MTFSVEDGRDELRARCSADLKGRMETFANEHNVKQAEVIRRAVDTYLPDTEDMAAPEDPDLREAYLWLQDRANDRGRINAPAAVSELSQRLGMKEEFVKSSRLEPLNRKGWITPRAGTITVLSPDEGADQ